MTEQEKEKKRFRQRKEWSEFRQQQKEKHKIDPITGKKLVKSFELHHLDLNPEHYTDLNEEHFIPLNKNTHKFIHWLYNYFLEDEGVIERIREVLVQMKQINS